MEKATQMPDYRDDSRADSARERVVVVMPGANQATLEDGPRLEELWGALYKDRWWIILIALLCGTVMATYAFTTKVWYHAEVLLSPANERGSGSLSGSLGQLSSLASVAGINLGGNNNANTEAIAVLKSRDFARSFIEDEHLLTVLMADDWDAKAGRWKGKDPAKWPDVRDAIKYFDKNVRQVQDDKKTGLVILGIDWTDSQTAADWANILVARLNERMRQRALTDAEANVSFLQQELGGTNVVTLQQSIGRLLEGELEKVMMARGNKEFAYHVVDRAYQPKWRTRPQRIQLVALGITGGGVLAAIGVLIRNASRRSRQRRESAAANDAAARA
jgi:uncharacterized protein involved in exopolysaccharide biosynthesis